MNIILTTSAFLMILIGFGLLTMATDLRHGNSHVWKHFFILSCATCAAGLAFLYLAILKKGF